MQLVSIIIPAYNGERFIEKCIKSCLSQTYNNIEIIVIDDGSDDNTGSLLEKYKDTITIIHQENKGGAQARNVGLKHSKGDFLLFLDSDDFLVENAIEKLVQAIKKDDSDMAIGNYIELSKNDSKIAYVETYKKNKVFSDDQIQELFIKAPNPSTKLYKKSIILKNKIEYSNVKIGQDLNFYLKYILACKRISVIKNYIYYYRIIEGSISRSYDERILEITKVFDDVEKYAKQKGARDNEKQAILYAKRMHIGAQLKKIKKINDKHKRRIIFQKLKNELDTITVEKNNILYKKTIFSGIKIKIRVVVYSILYSISTMERSK